MQFLSTDIRDLFILEPNVYVDKRGYFLETYRHQHFRDQGIDVNFIQDNSSFSGRGTIRGLHYQAGRSAQAKLVMVSQGSIQDVAVDLRRESDTFGKYVSVILSEENHRQFFIPEGFAHGFAVLSECATIHYKCSTYYDAESENGILWSDPDVGIDWTISDPVISEKDATLPKLRDLDPDLLF